MKQRKIICAILRLCTSLLVCLTVQAQTNPNQPDTAMLKDGQMHIVLCGTGSPLPDATRASACTAVIAGGEFVLIDTGPGSWRKVALNNLPTASLSAVLLTHFHSDHIGDLGETLTMSWANGRRQRLDVYGPPGVERVVAGFAQAYAQDVDYRVAHHGEQAMPRNAAGATAHAVTISKADEAALVFERNGLKITAFNVAHDPVKPAYGYRLEYRGRVVVITGDTAKSANVAKHAAGADLLIHDVLAGDLLRMAADNFERNGDQRRAKLSRDITTYHASPVEAAETAAAAKVETLVLTHMVPPPVNQMIEQAFLRGVSNVFSGKVVIGKDGLRFDLSPREQ
ncbi:MAG: MBL fold metallo-hydrolase [Blastocatellia bacterium]